MSRDTEILHRETLDVLKSIEKELCLLNKKIDELMTEKYTTDDGGRTRRSLGAAIRVDG
jgi:hypothetical protein